MNLAVSIHMGISKNENKAINAKKVVMKIIAYNSQEPEAYKLSSRFRLARKRELSRLVALVDVSACSVCLYHPSRCDSQLRTCLASGRAKPLLLHEDSRGVQMS